MDKTNSETDRETGRLRERKERRRGGGRDRKGGFLYRGGGDVGARGRRDYAGGASVCVCARECVLHMCLRICSSQETNSCKHTHGNTTTHKADSRRHKRQKARTNMKTHTHTQKPH